MIEIAAIGGYDEVGKNMTAIKIDDEVIILDIGLFLPKIISYEENENKELSAKELIEIGAGPDDSIIEKWKNNAKAIVLGHAHLDHIGFAPYVANKYKCPILGTPFTLEVLKKIIEDKEIKVMNQIIPVNPNSSFKISKNITIEFINITHSTLQTVMIIIHTKYGDIVYANDFKFDNHPVLGKKPNYERLKELSKNTICLIVDSLYSGLEQKTPSEKVAREMLSDVLLGTENKDNAVIVTTFASHIARLKSIVDFGQKLRRKVVFLGRSLSKYVYAAKDTNLIDFKNVEIIGYAGKIKKKLREIEKNGRSNYLVVVTGHQAEPGSVLVKMVNGNLPFNFLDGDHIVFACKVIPDKVNIENREKLEAKLKKLGVRLFTNIHQSGHCGREDLRDLIEMLRPRHIIPAHGDEEKRIPLIELATELGYKRDKDVHLINNGDFLRII